MSEAKELTTEEEAELRRPEHTRNRAYSWVKDSLLATLGASRAETKAQRERAEMAEARVVVLEEALSQAEDALSACANGSDDHNAVRAALEAK